MNRLLKASFGIFLSALLCVSGTPSFAAEEGYVTILQQKNYVVGYGDTLSGIALRFGTSVNGLMGGDLNPRLEERENPDLIYAGEDISLPYFNEVTVPKSKVFLPETRIVTTFGELEKMGADIEAYKRKFLAFEKLARDFNNELSETISEFAKTENELLEMREIYALSLEAYENINNELAKTKNELLEAQNELSKLNRYNSEIFVAEFELLKEQVVMRANLQKVVGQNTELASAKKTLEDEKKTLTSSVLTLELAIEKNLDRA